MIFRGSQVAIVAAYFVLLIVVGTVGYELIEGWNWADSFYMTIITITAVGYHEVHPLSETGRLGGLGPGAPLGGVVHGPEREGPPPLPPQVERLRAYVG